MLNVQAEDVDDTDGVEQGDDIDESTTLLSNNEAPRGWTPYTWWCTLSLTLRTIVCALCGFGLGTALNLLGVKGVSIQLIGYPGLLYINGLKCAVVPFVSVVVMMAVASMDTSSSFARTALVKAFLLMLLFVCCGVGIGSGLSFAINPGAGEAHVPTNSSSDTAFSSTQSASVPQFHISGMLGAPLSTETQGSDSVLDILLGIGTQVVPPDVIGAYTSGNMLGVMFFSFLIAFYIKESDSAEPFFNWVRALQHGLSKFIALIISWTPLGVFSLVSSALGSSDDLGRLFASLGLYVACVFAALLLHVLLVCCCFVFLVRKSPLVLLRMASQPMLTAFATASSAAALPLELQSIKDFGAKDSTVDFLGPLVNQLGKSGSATFIAVAARYLVNISGHSFTFADVIVVFVVDVALSFSTPPVPNSSLVLLVLCLKAAGFVIGEELAVILGIDWLLDRTRTTLNVLTHIAGMAILTRHETRESHRQAP